MRCLLLVLLLLSACGGKTGTGRESARPDVLLITVDTLRADALEHAPELSAVLERGTVFDSAWSPSSWTLPSYASLFSALPAHEHGAGRAPFSREPALGKEERTHSPIRTDVPLLAEQFAAAGYATAMFYSNPVIVPPLGLDRGFGTYERLPVDVRNTVESGREWWAENAGQPRFLVLHIMEPHMLYDDHGAGLEDPFTELDIRSFFDRDHTWLERKVFFDLPEYQRAIVRERYAAEVRAIDSPLATWAGQLLGSLDPPLLIFHADHGEELWDHGSFEHGHSFYDELLHVPLALVWPGRISAEHLNHPVRVRDLGPSLLRLVGLPQPSGWAGDLWEPMTEYHATGLVYRSQHGGRTYRHGVWAFEPFEAVFSRPRHDTGAADLDPEDRRAIEELGYF